MNLNAKALNISTTITLWFIVIVTIWSELSKPFKNFLADITGHHWVTKGVLSIVVFGAAYLVLMRLFKDSRNEVSSIYTVIMSAILGGLIIFIFYIWHFIS